MVEALSREQTQERREDAGEDKISKKKGQRRRDRLAGLGRGKLSQAKASTKLAMAGPSWDKERNPEQIQSEHGQARGKARAGLARW